MNAKLAWASGVISACATLLAAEALAARQQPSPAVPSRPKAPILPPKPTGLPSGMPPAQPAQPGSTHDAETERKVLSDTVGVFDVQMSVFLEPGAEPVKLKAKATREMILGGRFLLERLESTSSDHPYAAMTVTGFNPAGQEGPRFEIVRYNTMSSSTMPEAGQWDEATRTLFSKGEHENAGMLARVRTVEKHESADHFTTEFHVAFEGYSLEFKGMRMPEYRTMVLEYQRVRP